MDEIEEIKDLQKRIEATADTIVGLENSIIRMKNEQIELKHQWNVKTYSWCDEDTVWDYFNKQ